MAVAPPQGRFEARAGRELKFQIEDGFNDAVEARSFFDLVGALSFLEPPRQLCQPQNAREFGFREGPPAYSTNFESVARSTWLMRVGAHPLSESL